MVFERIPKKKMSVKKFTNLREVKILSKESMQMLSNEDLNEIYKEFREYYSDDEIGGLDFNVQFDDHPTAEKRDIIHHLLNKNVPSWFGILLRAICKTILLNMYEPLKYVYNTKSRINNYFRSFFRNQSVQEIAELSKSRYGSKQLKWLKFFALAFNVMVGGATLYYTGNIYYLVLTYFSTASVGGLTLFLRTSKNREKKFVERVVSIYERAWERMDTNRKLQQSTSISLERRAAEMSDSKDFSSFETNNAAKRGDEEHRYDGENISALYTSERARPPPKKTVSRGRGRRKVSFTESVRGKGAEFLRQREAAREWAEQQKKTKRS